MLQSKYYPYFCFSALVFLVVPGVFIYQSVGEVSHVNALTLLLLSVSLFVFSMLVFLLTHGLLSVAEKDKYLTAITVILMFYVFITGLLFPVSESSGLISLSATPVDKLNLVLALVATVVLYLFYCGKHQLRVLQVFSVMLGLNFIVAMYGYVVLSGTEKEPAKNEAEASIHKASSTKNIFVVSFDGIARDSIYQALQKDKLLQEYLNGFVFFNNVSSSSPATTASIHGELLGNQNFKEKADTQKEFTKVYKDKLITNVLDESEYEVTTYGVYTNGFKENSREYGEGRLLGEISPFIVSGQALHIFDIVAVRMFTKHVMQLTHFIKIRLGLKQKIARFLSLNNEYKYQDLYNKLSQSKAPHWAVTMPLGYLGYNIYVDKLAVSKEVPVAHFMHYTFSHYPVTLDSDCSYRGHEAKWYNSHQNGAGVDAVSDCAIVKIREYLDKIKALGIYDRSIIVFKSDHGKPSNYYPKDSIESFTIHGHEHWGYSRYTPFLMIKGMNQGDTPMRVNESAVLLGDLAKTLCKHAGVDLSCSEFPGFDLLSDDLVVPESADVYYYALKGKKSNFMFDTHEVIKLKRSQNFYDNIHNYYVDLNTSQAITCDASFGLESGHAFNNGRTDTKSWAWWRTKNELNIAINGTGCTGDYKLKINAYDFKSDGVEFKKPQVFVNNQLRSESELAVDNSGLGLELKITSEDFIDGKLKVRLVSDSVSGGKLSWGGFHSL